MEKEIVYKVVTEIPNPDKVKNMKNYIKDKIQETVQAAREAHIKRLVGCIKAIALNRKLHVGEDMLRVITYAQKVKV